MKKDIIRACASITACALFFIAPGCSQQKHSRLSPVSFHLVSAHPGPGCLKVEGNVPRPEVLYLEKKPQLIIEDIESASYRPAEEPLLGKFEVRLRLTSKGRDKLYMLTGNNLKRRLAVLVDGKLIMAPKILTPVSSGNISLGDTYTEQEAATIVSFINIARRRSLVSDKEAFQIGVAYAKKGDNDEAIYYFTRAIERDPRLAQAFYNRGLAYGNKGDYDKALFNFTCAIELKADYAKAYRERGVAYIKSKEYQKAFLDVNKALELDPEDWRSIVMRAALYARAGAYQGAVSDYSTLMRLRPGYAPAYVYRGVLLYRIGKFSEAFSDFAYAAKLTEDKKLLEGFTKLLPAKTPEDTHNIHDKILQVLRPK